MNNIIKWYQNILDRPWIGISLWIALFIFGAFLFSRISPDTNLDLNRTQYLLIRDSENETIDAARLCKIKSWYQSLNTQQFGIKQSLSLFDINTFKLDNQAVINEPLITNECLANSSWQLVYQNPLWNRLWTNSAGSDLLIQIHADPEKNVDGSAIRRNFNSAVQTSTLELSAFSANPTAVLKAKSKLWQFFGIFGLLLLPVFLFRRFLLVSLAGLFLILFSNGLTALLLSTLIYNNQDFDSVGLVSIVLGCLIATLLNVRWFFLATHSSDFHLHNHFTKSFTIELWFRLSSYIILISFGYVVGWDLSSEFLVSYAICDFVLMITLRFVLPALLELLPGIRNIQNQSAISFFSHFRIFRSQISIHPLLAAFTWLVGLLVTLFSIDFGFSPLSNQDRISQYLQSTRGWSFSLPLEVHQTQDENSAIQTLERIDEIDGVRFVENPFVITEESVKDLGSGFRTDAKQKALTQPSSRWFFAQPYSIETRVYITHPSLKKLSETIDQLLTLCSGSLCTFKKEEFKRVRQIATTPASLPSLVLIAIVWVGFLFFVIYRKSSVSGKAFLCAIATLPALMSLVVVGFSTGILSLLLWPFVFLGFAWGILEILAITSKIHEKNAAYISSIACCFLLPLSLFFFDLNLGYQSLILILPLLYCSFLLTFTLDSTLHRLSWDNRLQA